VSVTFVVGDALGDALVRPGRVVVRLVFDQDAAQMLPAEDEDAIQELAAQGAFQAFADRFDARRDGGPTTAASCTAQARLPCRRLLPGADQAPARPWRPPQGIRASRVDGPG
jgi:hypothetical protein